MNIFKDMDLVYDLKMADKENEIHTKTGLEGYGRAMYKRMNPQQKAAWDAYYDPIIKDFKARKLEGKELAEWKYQRYMHDYLSVIRSVDRNIGRVLKYLEEKGLLENTLVVILPTRDSIWENTVGLTNALCTRSHSVLRC